MGHRLLCGASFRCAKVPVSEGPQHPAPLASLALLPKRARILPDPLPRAGRENRRQPPRRIPMVVGRMSRCAMHYVVLCYVLDLLDFLTLEATEVRVHAYTLTP